MAQQKNESSTHPNHPIRNFFYILWLILVLAAFVALFVGITLFADGIGKLLTFASAAILVLAIAVGVIVPAHKQRKFQNWKKRHG